MVLKSNKSKVLKWKFVSEKDIFPAASVFDICQRSTGTKIENMKFYQLFETNVKIAQFLFCKNTKSFKAY